MSPREALREGARILAAAPGGSETAFLDASLLLGMLLGLSREALLAAPDRDLEAGILADYRALLNRRAAGRPVAYLLGRKEFYGRDFLVDERVLVPRPDTELLVETALKLGDELAARRTLDLPGRGADSPRLDGPAAPGALHLLDLCTGSGALALSLAAERPAWRVTASDLSPEALTLARENARRLLPPDRPGGSAAFLQSDLLEALPGPYDLIVSNPPYVPRNEAERLAAAWGEPLLALDGGEDGLELCRRLVPAAFLRLAPGGLLLVEADPGEAAELRSLFSAAGFQEVRTERDLAGHERLSLGRKPWTN